MLDSTTGTANLPVNVDTAGMLDLSLQPLSPQASRRPGAKVADQIPVGQAGLVNVPISLSGQAERELETLHQLSLRAAVTFTATGGTPTTKTIVIQLVKLAPSISGLRISPRRFLLASRLVNGHCVAKTRKNRAHRSCRRPAALAVTYSLNQTTHVSFGVAQQQPGREVRRHCVKPTRKNQKRPRCMQLVALPGRISVTGRAGANRFIFTGKIGGRHLGVGSYVLTATLPGGRPASRGFQIAG